MDPLLVGIIAVVLLGLAVIVYMVIQSRGSESRAVLDRVRDIQDPTRQAPAPIEVEPTRSHFALPTLDRMLAGASFTASLMDTLSRAGWRLKPSEYVGMSVASISVGAIILTVLTRNTIGGVVGGLLGTRFRSLCLALPQGAGRMPWRHRFLTPCC